VRWCVCVRVRACVCVRVLRVHTRAHIRGCVLATGTCVRNTVADVSLSQS